VDAVGTRGAATSRPAPAALGVLPSRPDAGRRPENRMSAADPAVSGFIAEAGSRGAAARRHAAQDLAAGLRQWELWAVMGLQDVRRRYRRSVLGPFWLTLSLAFLVAALGLLYGRLMGVPTERYVPHVALGFIAWQFIQGAVGDGCNVFIANREWLTNVRTPLSLFVFRQTWGHLLAMAHNALVYLGVAILFGIFAGWAGLLVVPALALLVLNAVWVTLLLGILCARFRDIPLIVQSLLRVAFFLTPVMWLPDQLGERAHLALFNPFTYFVELLRAPLLGQVPPLATWALALAVTAIGWALAWPLFVRFRTRVSYWV
jgi:lipopolysaccharide transport system permease protein